MNLTYEEVAQMLAILDMAEGKDLEFSFGGRRVTLASWSEEAVAAREPLQAQTEPKPAVPRQDLMESGLVDVRAKRLGYYQPSAGIGVGVRVSEGDPLGQLVGLEGKGYEVRAPVSGQVVEICVEEQDFVEYGQFLVTIDTLSVATEPKMSGGPATGAAG